MDSMESSVRGIDGFVTGITFSADSVKKNIILKPKDRNATHVSEGESEQQGASSSVANSPVMSLDNVKRPLRPTDSRLGLNGSVSNDIAALECDFDTKSVSNDKFIKKTLHGSGFGSEKHEKRTRNKDRPDHGVWSPLHCSNFPK
ncbi:hypothetical protein ES319_D11G094300v1 [Gossypium barbadense]|uniref:Uncharacterized protein n=2 Tax=Gossypium TaxID=3633 RepID=A0A5J5P8Y1_GOSBA|nr:hypothetical protein ES319_D11G094300v1 [Gossypium barbadense]TYG44467.1 hypothetical protein ES288_D11G099100v1 [Gossypium darwinii]